MEFKHLQNLAKELGENIINDKLNNIIKYNFININIILLIKITLINIIFHIKFKLHYFIYF